MIRLWLGLVAVEIALTAIVAGQPAAAVAHPDLTGLWDGATGGPVPTAGSESAARLASGQPAEASGPASTRDLVDYMKRQGLAVPFTTYGAERYKNADMAKNPNSHCLPPGPSRALTGPSPFLIVQHDQKTGPDSIKYTVTYTDPVFFTKPWSASLSFQRQGKDDRLMEYVCNDNEKDRARLVPTLRDQ